MRHLTRRVNSELTFFVDRLLDEFDLEVRAMRIYFNHQCIKAVERSLGESPRECVQALAAHL